MHGNTFKAEDSNKVGYKTRDFEVVLKEVQETFAVHKELDSRCMGLHFELTGKAFRLEGHSQNYSSSRDSSIDAI